MSECIERVERKDDTEPRAGSGVVRIDPLPFLAGCHKRRLNQALSVLSLSLGFFRCMCCAFI